jgi:hypothetical protein
MAVISLRKADISAARIYLGLGEETIHLRGVGSKKNRAAADDFFMLGSIF